MLRSRERRKAGKPAVPNIANDTSTIETSHYHVRFGIAGFIVLATIAIVAVSVSNSNNQEESVQLQHGNIVESVETSQRSLNSVHSVVGHTLKKTLGDLSPLDSAHLQRLMSRQSRLPQHLNPRLKALEHHLGFSPLNALNGVPGLQQAKDVLLNTESSKELTFTVNNIFIRQTVPWKLGTLAEDSIDDVVLLFLHGAAYSSATWSELGILSGLADQGYVSYAVDCPGYGQSTGSKVKDNQWLVDLTNMLFSENTKTVSLQSQGQGMTWFNTAGKEFVIVTASMSGQYAVPLLFKPPSGLKGMITVAPVSTTKFTKEQYEKVEIPICIIYGELDDKLGEQSKENLVHVPNHQLIVVPDGEHAAYKTDPEFFLEQVIKWLGEFFD